jgi:hypothetical protein
VGECDFCCQEKLTCVKVNGKSIVRVSVQKLVEKKNSEGKLKEIKGKHMGKCKNCLVVS